MQIPNDALRALTAILQASAATRPISRHRLALRLGVGLGCVDSAIAQLSEAGWIDPGRLRLTFQGLAVATAFARVERPAAEVQRRRRRSAA